MRAAATNAREIGFLLLPGFALMSFAAATEPYRAANLIAGRDLYRLRFFGEANRIPASGGALIPAEPLARASSNLDILFVCAGGAPPDWRSAPVRACLRRLASAGVRLGGISGGPYILAAAGLMKGRRFTVHWEHATALVEAFPDLKPERARFVIDGDRLTCGGGVAPLDMSYALIAERMGADFARRILDWFLHTEIGASAGPQRSSTAERYHAHHAALVKALDKMAATVEAPLSRASMARFAGVSERHLNRLFAERVGTTFALEYRELRLQHALTLVQQSALRVSEIAFATGFSSAGHLSRRFKERFGESPHRLRATKRSGIPQRRRRVSARPASEPPG
jgi:AraC family transcriptional regulator, glycine betaine-responsive activator